MTAIGIDLGTSNSLIAVFQNDQPQLIENALGTFLTPSVVSLDDNGDIIVGQAAIDRLVSHPNLTAASFKRAMGTDKIFSLGKHRFRAEDLSALVLKSLKHDAEAYLGESITEAVISVPAYFNDNQRKATINAAVIAGLSVQRLINEPTAAALAHGLESVEEGRFLILDLGGGTFDVSLMHKYEGVMEIRASSGDSFLGGDDFRHTIEMMLVNKHEIDLSDLEPTDKARLVSEAERIKRVLTDAQQAAYHFSIGSKSLNSEITRTAFEEACQPLIRRMRVPIERVIRDSRVDISRLDQIILVGGASRIPLVRNLVVKLFGRFPTIHPNPDHIIGLGAAVQSALKLRNRSLDDVVMTDICPFTLGTAVVHDGPGMNIIFSPIIERNAVVPISRERQYSTAGDQQTHICFEVLQGESLRPDENVKLGEVNIKVPAGPAGREAIKTRFTYDVNGALEVIITVLSTGKVFQKIFQNSSGLSEEELAARFAAMSDIKLSPRDQAKNRALLAKANRLYSETLGDERARIQHLILWFEAALEEQSLHDLDRLRADFASALEPFDRSIF